MKVYFRTLRTKESFYIEENNDIKIKDLKKNLYKKKNINSSKLVYSGKLLKDENKLSEYFYKEGDMIILIQAKINIIDKSYKYINDSKVEEDNKNNLLLSTNNLIKNNINLLKNDYNIINLNDNNKKEIYDKVNDPDFLIKLLSFINKDNKDNNDKTNNDINDYINKLNFLDEDQKNIDEFIELGYNKEEISQIYLACNKDKKLIINILDDCN
tara:strand:+ start:296 stop:934 length:639 start_codon:yes stop_codon:yes gene_type:complete